MSQTARWIGLAVAVLGLFVGFHSLQVNLDAQKTVTPKLQRFMYLPQGEFLRVAVLGYRQVVADLLWIETIQAMGERKVSLEAGQWIAHALDVITTLDPYFVRVYEAGGIALSTLVPLYEESNRLFEKGIKYNPENWRLPYFLGFNYYFEFDDDRKAAEYIARASRLPGAPEYLGPFAARLYVSAREPQVALDFLLQTYAQTEDSNVKQVLEKRIKELVVERDLLSLEKAIRRYRAAVGHAPERLEDLVREGVLRNLPREPFGGRYLYDPKTQLVQSSEEPERMKLYGHRRLR